MFFYLPAETMLQFLSFTLVISSLFSLALFYRAIPKCNNGCSSVQGSLENGHAKHIDDALLYCFHSCSNHRTGYRTAYKKNILNTKQGF